MPTRREPPGTHRHDSLGLVLALPGKDWTKTLEPSSGAILVNLRGIEDQGKQVTLTYWESSGRRPRKELDAEFAAIAAEQRPVLLRRGRRPLGGVRSPALRYRMGSGDGSYLVESICSEREGIVCRLTAMLPAAREDEFERFVDAAAGSLRWRAPKRARLSTAPEPFELRAGAGENVATVVHGRGARAAFAYLEALPGAARANRGRPVVLVVGPKLGAPTRDFLRKFNPSRLRLVGRPHPELPQARPADDSWTPGRPVVVAPRSLKHAVPAAALALRLRVPLLIAGRGLERRVLALSPSRVLAVGDVRCRTGLATTRLPDALAVAKASGPSGYVAWCNAGRGKDAGAAVFAAALAGTHAGVVLPFERRVRWHAASLRLTDEAPPGMPASKTGRYGAGRLRIAGRSIAVAAPVVATMKLTSHLDSPWFGRPRIDLDGDGVLGPKEEPAIGSTVRVGGRRYLFTARFTSPSGSGARERRGSSGVMLLEPAPDELKDGLHAFIRRLGGVEHLAIVGRPDRIPFARAECRSYFQGYALQQELATDAPYGALNADSLHGLAVGRLLPDGLENGSAHVATAIAYPQLEGAWKERAAVIQPGFADHEAKTGYSWVMPDAEALLKSISRDLRWVGVHADEFFRDKVDADGAAAALGRAGWIAFCSHADQQSWSLHEDSRIVPTWKSRLFDRPARGTAVLPALEGAPLVYCGGCLSAGVDLGYAAESSYPERFFQLGAAAYLGNTRTASPGSEHAIKTFFNRVLFDGATLGVAFRDGRNHLAHLLTLGHVDPQLGSGPADPQLYDLLWEQYHNMNLFGDPGLALRPAAEPPVSVSLAPRDEGRARLIIRRTGPERVDPVQVMPALGKGKPREVYVRTGPGLTCTDVPYAYMTHEDGLSPIRSFPQLPPGAWVDVALPAGARDVRVVLREGPRWADRGFAVERGLKGEPRLQLYVPLTRATLEEGAGSALERVAFDVSFARGSSARAALRVPRIVDELPWEEPRLGGRGVIAPAASRVLDGLRASSYDPHRLGLREIELTLSCPDSRWFQGARFDVSWDRRAGTRVRSRNLPAAFEARRASLERGVRRLFEGTLLPGAWMSLAPRGYHVDAERSADGREVLKLYPARPREGEETLELRLESACTHRAILSRFGARTERRYEWRETPRGRLLSKVDLQMGMATVEQEYEHREVCGYMLPVKLTTLLPGYQAKPFRYLFRYQRVR